MLTPTPHASAPATAAAANAAITAFQRGSALGRLVQGPMCMEDGRTAGIIIMVVVVAAAAAAAAIRW